MTKKEKVFNELKKGEKESAATIALGRSSRSTNASGTSFKFGSAKMVFFIALLLIVMTAVSTWIFASNLFKIEPTFKQETTVFVEQIQDLATLATAEAHLKVVIEQEDNKLFGKDISLNLPGTKRELLLVVPATVLAGVNLSGVTSENLNINEEKKQLEITLPRATFIQDPAIQMNEVKTFSDEGLFRSEAKWAEGFDLAAEAQQQIIDEASEIGLLQTAEQSAEKVLKGFFSNLGYTVEITFR